MTILLFVQTLLEDARMRENFKILLGIFWNVSLLGKTLGAGKMRRMPTFKVRST